MAIMGYACTDIAADLCTRCGPHFYGPNSCCQPHYSWDETSTPLSCGNCGAYIPVSWNSEAAAYAKAAAARGPIPPEWEEELSLYWD
jgi:hypothetical protein